MDGINTGVNLFSDFLRATSDFVGDHLLARLGIAVLGYLAADSMTGGDNKIVSAIAGAALGLFSETILDKTADLAERGGSYLVSALQR